MDEKKAVESFPGEEATIQIEQLHKQYDELKEEKDDLEVIVDRFGSNEIIEVETGLGIVTMSSPNLRLTHELEAFAEALAAKYGGRVL